MTTQHILKDLAILNESTWVHLGQVAELMNDSERALVLYEQALAHNPFSEQSLVAVATVCRSLEKYQKAADYFQRALKIKDTNGEVWGALGHCYLMLDDLHKAYSAYQQALFHLPNPKEPKLWYGIGILYDRYGSFEHAEDAFTAVIEMDPLFEKSNEIYFRLGIIYKQQGKFENSMECFRYILKSPPPPLSELDILFQIGHVYEQKKDFDLAKETYEQILKSSPKHAKVLQQLGWLYHQPSTGFTNDEFAMKYLLESSEADPQDAQTWYLLGRCHMAMQKYNEAYNSYQQAVYRDGRNPTFWCSIGVLYYQINQYSDALDAYGRALRLNPYISEVWFDLGTLYESCENQVSDAIDAYTKALELDPNSQVINQRLQYLKNPNNQPLQPALQPQQPAPQDMVQAKYPHQGGSAPSNFKNGHIGEFQVKKALMQREPASHQNHPPPSSLQPPLGHHRKASLEMNSPQIRRGPMILGQQLNRAGLPDDEKEPSRRLHPASDSGSEQKRY